MPIRKLTRQPSRDRKLVTTRIAQGVAIVRERSHTTLLIQCGAGHIERQRVPAEILD
jgi:hypothetical protein